MPFNLRETIFGSRHFCLGICRRLSKRSAMFYLDRLRKSGLSLNLSQSEKNIAICNICGYAIAEVQLEENWIMQACSATGFKTILKTARFNSWFTGLSAREPTAIGDHQ